MNAAGVLASLPAEVRAILATRSVEPGDLLAVVDADADDLVLLTGSVARGEVRPNSDLDLLVLTKRRRVRTGTDALSFPSVLGESLDSERHGVHFNVEYIAVDQVERLARILRPVAHRTASLPNLQQLELRLVQGLHTGLVLQGGPEVDTLRRTVDLADVQAAVTALHFVGTLTLLENSTLVAGSAGPVLRRASAEALLIAGLCAHGPLTYDVKHLVSRAVKLARQPGLPSLFARHDELLFADRLPASESITLILDLSAELHTTFGSPVRALLTPFRTGWAWSGRDFR